MRQSEKDKQATELNSKLLPFAMHETLEKESLLSAIEMAGDAVAGIAEIQSIKQKQGR
ncbi:hypothetical protein [Aneurinibacillus tyrosinisolvens]|uniref:hypothetical protein n=1 Tax=Aneurinibacillus tyrosinisolvens TaxID=1443435 RepID=UPI000A679304|nr:hypothetical protein [Aneurinibacillus tyrosinisolvens]